MTARQLIAIAAIGLGLVLAAFGVYALSLSFLTNPETLFAGDRADALRSQATIALAGACTAIVAALLLVGQGNPDV